MKGEFYLGAICRVDKGEIPLRIGQPFRAERIADARAIGADMLAAQGVAYGYLCRVHDGKVMVLSSLRSDGMWSPVLIWQGCTPQEDSSRFGWRSVR